MLFLEKKIHKAKQEKMFVCEIPGGQKNVHQADRESIFFLIFKLAKGKKKQTVKVKHSYSPKHLNNNNRTSNITL